jgi:crossover junction endodeoxyribonuclease RusA
VSAFELWVPGRPKAKQRPRLGRRRKAFTPEATIIEEDRIAALWVEAGGPVFEGQVAVLVDYWPEGQRIRVEERDWTSSLNADLDNLAKLTNDALQKVAFADDRHVVELHVGKFPRGTAPTD